MRKLVMLSLTLLLTAAASAAEFTETVDRTFDVRPGASVTLSNVNGAVTISAWDQPRVRVIARKRVESNADNAKAVLGELRIDMQPRNGGLAITTKYPNRDGGFLDWLFGKNVDAQVRYELTVPRSMSLDVENVNGGIHVFDVSGKHELATTNGKIEVARCAGSLDASTTNGAITAELTNVQKGAPLRFSTTNGRIDVKLPASVAVDVDADTTNGRIQSDLPIATTQFGDNSLRGSINGGGTPLKLRTTNGGIQIRATR
ncbi:MAG: DUF4097 family beta strand repeat-containing protein [Acidobacteriota bacterium]|nr:DUF4097 family beta strand repeat-containing protein [Acidobacteriota bacterium]